jgi:hypothetical protein
MFPGGTDRCKEALIVPDANVANGSREVFVEVAYLEVVVGHLIEVVEQSPTLYPLLHGKQEYLEIQAVLIYYNEIFDLFDDEEGLPRSADVRNELVRALGTVSRETAREGEFLTPHYLNQKYASSQRRNKGSRAEFLAPTSARTVLAVVERLSLLYAEDDAAGAPG